MKDKLLLVIKKFYPFLIVVIVFEMRILQMFFTTSPRPPIYQLFVMLFICGIVAFCVSYSLFLVIVTFLKSLTSTPKISAENSKKYQSKSLHKKQKEVKQPTINSSDRFIKRINTKVVGVTYDCDLVRYTKRQDWLENLSDCIDDWKDVHLQYYEFRGEPAFYVMYKKYDLGNLRRELSLSLVENYPNCKYIVRINRITGGYNSKNYGCNIDIDIYAPLEDTTKESE